MSGILLIDKPAGWTSFDVVNYIRKRTGGKVGHAGTLDPFATGLLIILVGKEFTKRAVEFSKLDKTYEVTMQLGATSSTGDPEGEITPVNDTIPTKNDISAAFKKFTGTISQTPPAYSAIKVNGQRAYKLARAGQEVNLEPRQVTINSLKLIKYDYPDIKFTADVSSGTYIRSLVEDIGNSLDTSAYTKALRRTKINGFSVEKATLVKDF